MARTKIQVIGGPGAQPRTITIDTEATKGATLGTDVYLPSGAVATPTTFLQWLGTPPTQSSGSSGSSSGPSLSSILTTKGDLATRDTNVQRLPIGTVNQLLRVSAGGLPEWATVGGSTGADPTAQVGLTAVNGVATTFLRSDGAPALDQGIAPTWTGVHTHTNQLLQSTSGTRALLGSSNLYNILDGSVFIVRDYTTTRSLFSAASSGLNYGNSTDYPPHVFYGDALFRGATSVNTGFLRPVAASGISGFSLISSNTNSGWSIFDQGALGNLNFSTYLGGRNVYGATQDGSGNVTAISYGNVTDNPPHTFYGALTLNSYGAGALSSNGSGAVSAGVLSAPNGGTGFGSYATGDLLYASSSSALSKLGIGTSGYVLTVSGGVPAWAAAPSGAVGANPTASVGLTAVNGSATTYLRSDGAPALDQGIAPTWSGQHTFSLSLLGPAGSNSAPAFSFSGDPDTGMYSGGANILRFATNGTSRLVIGTGGAAQFSSSVEANAFEVGAGGSVTNGMILQSSGDLRFNAAGVMTLRLEYNGSVHTSTFTGIVVTPAATSTQAGLRLPHGSAPSSPVNGDMWTTTAGLYVRINGATIGPLS